MTEQLYALIMELNFMLQHTLKRIEKFEDRQEILQFQNMSIIQHIAPYRKDIFKCPWRNIYDFIEKDDMEIEK